jgi:DNA-binding transcriptional LysR family regulator
VTLTLAASHTISEFLLPGWLAAFRTLEATVRSKVEIVDSTGVIAAVRNRHTEIGFVEGLDSLEGLHVVDLHRDHIVVVVARSHRWARRRSFTAADLAREPYLTPRHTAARFDGFWKCGDPALERTLD